MICDILGLKVDVFFTLVFSFVVAASTVFYAILTRALVRETKLMRKAQVEPYVIAYLMGTDTHSSIIYLCTKNIGQGVALNVRFKLEKDFKHAFKNFLSYSYFKDGVKYFPPGKEDKHLVLSFSGAKSEGEQLNDSIRFVVEYETILGENKTNRYELNVKEIAGQGPLTPPGTYVGMISYRLEKIEKLTDKLFRIIERKLNKDENATKQD